MGLFGRRPSLDELLKMLAALSDDDKKKVKEALFDAERDEVKADEAEDLAEVDGDEGEVEEAKAEEAKATEEATEGEAEAEKAEEDVEGDGVGPVESDALPLDDEAPAEGAPADEPMSADAPAEEPAPEAESGVETEEEKARAAAYDARFKALEESIAALTEKITALLDDADDGRAFGASPVGTYEDKEENGDRAVMASYNRTFRG